MVTCVRFELDALASKVLMGSLGPVRKRASALVLNVIRIGDRRSLVDDKSGSGGCTW